MRVRNGSSSSSEFESDATASSSSTSQFSERTVIKTVGVKTLICDTEMGRPRGATSGRDDARPPVDNNRQQRRTSNDEPPLSPTSSSSTTTSSSTYKRYKFGLTNHFLTMPDMDEQQQAKVYQKSSELLNQKHKKSNYARKYGPSENKRNSSNGNDDQNSKHARRRLRVQMNARVREDKQRNQRQDSDCDLSVLPPSSSDANSLLSHESNWSPLDERANTTETSQLAQSSSSEGSSSSGGKLHQHQQHPPNKHTNHSFLNQDLADVPRLMPAGDAGLDASRCNSKASHHHHHQNHHLNHNLTSATHPPAADCYLDPDAYHMQQQQSRHRPKLGHKSVHSSGSHHPNSSRSEFNPVAHHQQQQQQQNQDHMRKRMKLSGDVPEDDHDCASNGLLVRLGSIMYATFLVILGCILHVSELRQKSRNSSDHIYTTIVALLGIFWLLFLQGDLQRYKRYASKFILLESIFNDHHHHQQQREAQQQLRQLKSASQSGVGGARQSTSGGGLLGLDPSARSTTSSSASLVNDRMSMNTEVIFKKTAYKMYEQQAAASPPSLPPPPPPPPLLSQHYKLAAAGNPLKYHHQQGLGASDDPAAAAAATTPRLVPAYKFLHGKMGANFYLKCGMAAFCFGHVIHEGLRFGQQVYFFATNNGPCRDSAALVAHLVTPLYSFYQLFMMFKYSNLVINRHKVLARFGLMHIIGTCVTFWFRTILEEAFEDFVHKMDYFKAQNKPMIHYLDPTGTLGSKQPPLHSAGGADLLLTPTNNAGLAHWLGSLASLTVGGEPATNGQLAQQVAPLINVAPPHQQQNLTLLAQSTLLALMSSPMSATITPQIVRHLPDSYHCAQNTLLTTKSMNALPYLYPFTIEYNLLIAAIFLSLYFNIGKLGDGGGGASSNSHGVDMHHAPHTRCYLACCRPPMATTAPSVVGLTAAPPSPYYNHAVSKQPGSQLGSSGAASFIEGSQLDLIASSTTSGASESCANLSYANGQQQQQQQQQQPAHSYNEKCAGEYKSNFVVNADCHAANKGLFLGFFVLLVTLVTIVIFFVTISKPSHVQLGIKINLIQEATLTSLILIVTLAGYRQIMRLNQNPFIKNNITTDDVLMLIPLPFFFIHSLLSIRAETATLYTPHHLTLGKSGSGLPGGGGGGSDGISALEAAASVLKLGAGDHRFATAQNNSRVNPRADFMLGLPSGMSGGGGSDSNRTTANRLLLLHGANATSEHQKQQQEEKSKAKTMDHYKLLTIVLNLAVMIEVLVQTNFIIDGLRRCSESRYLRFKKPGRELITFAIILNITYWIVATFETKSVEQYKTEIDYYGPLPYMFISHTTLPVMLFYRYHSSVCLAEIWNRAYKPPKRR